MLLPIPNPVPNPPDIELYAVEVGLLGSLFVVVPCAGASVFTLGTYYFTVGLLWIIYDMLWAGATL
jgi:hypothetical protein